ncbi:hypothetical protein MMC21_005319 [Puttea exsequens]|nr:hypothetical protein [Puttea exsequens]
MSFLRSPVSGLQQLFSSASSLTPHNPRGQRQLESYAEESHTYDLLYPEGETSSKIYHNTYPLKPNDPAFLAAAADSSDDRGGLDIQSPRDVRVIIAQDANALSSQPRVLFDSQPTIRQPPTRSGSPEALHSRTRGDSLGGGMRRNNSIQKSHTAPHSRQSSLSQTAQSMFTSPSTLSPVNELGSLFASSKSRTGDTKPPANDGENIQLKMAKEAREDTEILMDCMFGAAGFPSVASTKLHIRPPKLDVANSPRPTSAREVTFPLPKRRTPLTRSTTATDLQTLTTVSEDAYEQAARRKSTSVLVTRLFSVDPIVSEDCIQGPEKSESQVGRSSDHAEDLESAGLNPTSSEKVKKAQLKTPTYSVAILLQMPAHRQRPTTPRFQGPSSSGAVQWSSDLMLGGAESNDDIEYITTHWNIIARTLASLEDLARSKIGNALSVLDLPQPAVRPIDPPRSMDNGADDKSRKSKQRQLAVQLPESALQDCPTTNEVTTQLGKRVALGLRIRRVAPGQARWGIWREEARWVDRWAAGRDGNYFLLNLLTSFLAYHAEWLDILGPSQYKRRRAKDAQLHGQDANIIQHRTVIVSRNKMSARRLIFLLVAFLPGNPLDFALDGQQQSDASWSHNFGCSQSPPLAMRSYRPHATTKNAARMSTHSPKKFTHARAVSFTDPDVTAKGAAPTEVSQADQRNRRGSDARSIRSAALPISSNNSTRKSSTTTTATVVPEQRLDDPAIGVGYFYQSGTPSEPRPGSSGSLASQSLMRTLSRSESNEYATTSTESHSFGRGSWLSSFWSDRRDSSTEDSDPLGSSDDGLGISGVPKDARSQRSATTLSQMVKDVELNGTPAPTTSHQSPDSRRPRRQDSASTDASPPRRMLLPSWREDFPLKLSVDEDDGVVDIGLPPTSHASSFESHKSSPLAIRSAASSFNQPSSLQSRTSRHSLRHANANHTVDVSGWLRSFHQDFDLQAIRPYNNFKDDIKHSMRTEPTPSNPAAASDTNGFTDVSTTLIADASKFTITRLNLRRRNPNSPHHQNLALLGAPPSEDEHFTERPLDSADPTLTAAIERVLAQSGHSSRNTSRAPSPARRADQTSAQPSWSPGLGVHHSECQTLVLSALRHVVRSVRDEMAREEGVGTGFTANSIRGTGAEENVLREEVRRCLI